MNAFFLVYIAFILFPICTNIIAAYVHDKQSDKAPGTGSACGFVYVWSRFCVEIWNCCFPIVFKTLRSWDFSLKEEKTKRDWKQRTFQIFFFYIKKYWISDMIGKGLSGAVKAVHYEHINQWCHRWFHFHNPSAKEETLNSLHLVFPIHPASTIMKCNFFFKKRKTLHCTSQCFFFIRAQIQFFFNMSLKCKFYSTTAREITLKREKKYAKEAVKQEASHVSGVTWPLWWHIPFPPPQQRWMSPHQSRTRWLPCKQRGEVGWVKKGWRGEGTPGTTWSFFSL